MSKTETHKHTPGPWLPSAGSRYVYEEDGGKDVALLAVRTPEEEQANARLIATAPTLLARLKTHEGAACLGWNNRFNLPDCECGPCLDRAAIAKAEGK